MGRRDDSPHNQCVVIVAPTPGLPLVAPPRSGNGSTHSEPGDVIEDGDGINNSSCARRLGDAL
jgi:hypothetical protein